MLLVYMSSWIFFFFTHRFQASPTTTPNKTTPPTEMPIIAPVDNCVLESAVARAVVVIRGVVEVEVAVCGGQNVSPVGQVGVVVVTVVVGSEVAVD